MVTVDLSTAAQWAQDSLDLHSSDEREYVYSLEEFEDAQTHDDLWNAAQIQLTSSGKMHGFVSVIIYSMLLFKSISSRNFRICNSCECIGVRKSSSGAYAKYAL